MLDEKDHPNALQQLDFEVRQQQIGPCEVNDLPRPQET